MKNKTFFYYSKPVPRMTRAVLKARHPTRTARWSRTEKRRRSTRSERSARPKRKLAQNRTSIVTRRIRVQRRRNIVVRKSPKVGAKHPRKRRSPNINDDIKCK